MTRSVAVIGSGPAGLMAATELAHAGLAVTLIEKRPAAGRKLLVAGSSGLNVSHDCSPEAFAEQYGKDSAHFARVLEEFPPRAWLDFIESLGVKTFRGTSRRYFTEAERPGQVEKASTLLKAWIDLLRQLKVTFEFGQECVDFTAPEVSLTLAKSGHPERTLRFDAALFCLGGGSWEPQESPLRWPGLFLKKTVGFSDFRASNVGYEIDWPDQLVQEAEGKPFKKIELHTARGSKTGELVLTRYGLEGTPVYSIGTPGEARLDLKPDLDMEEIRERLEKSRENLSPIRRVKKLLSLSEASFALLFHTTPPEILQDLDRLCARIKNVPLALKAPRPLSEAISSSGGILMTELSPDLEFKKYPGIYAAGEMLDWDAPTGGFLIQGCVSQGHFAATRIIEKLKSP